MEQTDATEKKGACVVRFHTIVHVSTAWRLLDSEQMSHSMARGTLFGMVCFGLVVPASVLAVGSMRYVTNRPSAGSFPIVQDKRAAPIWMDANDYAGVARAASNLQADIARVTGCTPDLT